MILAIVSRYENIVSEEPLNEKYCTLKGFYDVFDELDILLFPVASNKNLDKVSDICDGLIITGCDFDIHPKHYHEPLSPYTNLGTIDEYLLDAALIEEFAKSNKPILGICGGAQSINTYFGGSSIQDIKNHDLTKDKHRIMINKGSFLYKTYREDAICVNSLHHQAIANPAPDFIVSAISEEGIVEAIEKENIIGVQWHPETMRDKKFFNSFITSFFSGTIASLRMLPVLAYASADETIYGCDQNHYASWWRRAAGCGPSVAATTLQYISVSRKDLQLPFNLGNKEAAIDVMNTAWGFVTPGVRGLNSTERYANGMTNLLASYHVKAVSKILDVSEDKKQRPSAEETEIFIKESLLADMPVAFLNFDSGELTNLEGWHWTLIVSLDTERNEIIVYEQGKRHTLDLRLWLHTTKRGGGFVWIDELALQ